MSILGKIVGQLESGGSGNYLIQEDITSVETARSKPSLVIGYIDTEDESVKQFSFNIIIMGAISSGMMNDMISMDGFIYKDQIRILRYRKCREISDMLNTTLQKEQEGDQQYFSLCISSFPNEIDEVQSDFHFKAEGFTQSPNAGFFKATASQTESRNGIMNSNLLDSIVVKKDNDEIEELESRIEALESAKTSLESRIAALESPSG